MKIHRPAESSVYLLAKLVVRRSDGKGACGFHYSSSGRKGLRNSTIGKQLGFLKWFLKWSANNGYHKNMAYLSFKPKLKTTEKRIIFLTWDELMTVYNFSIPESKKYLDRVRDVFCFCCFTSLRYSDVYNLKRFDIKMGHFILQR